MATQTTQPMNVASATAFERMSSQFRGLSLREPGQWPLLPKLCAWIGATLVVVALGWVLLLSSEADELDAARNREPTLKTEYRSRLAQAINLSELRRQKQQVQEYVTQLEKQLPGKADMDALISDINQAGIGRGLQFELLRPGAVQVKDYYAELPIALRVTGRYHDLGAFAADIANLSRIVTLNNLTIAAPGRDSAAATTGALPPGTLVLDATARTYRYLSPEELVENQKAKAGVAKPGAKK